MKSKKLLPFLIVFAIIFIILYIIFAFQPLAKEYTFSPDWIIDVTSPDIKASDETPVYFKFGQSIGYFTKDGDVTLCKTFPVKAAISDEYYAIYTTEAENIPFFDNKGNQQGTIKTAGFPFFNDDRIYMFLPGGGSFSKCNEKGDIVWTCESTIPVTAFSSNENYTTCGYADGNIKVFDNESGQIEINFAPGGSDYSVIYGLDISPDGQYVASVSGLDNQRFVLAHKEEGQPKIIYHNFLDSDLNRRTFVKFSSDGKRVFYNYKDNLGIYDLENNKSFVIPIDKKILSIEEADDVYFLLGKNNNQYTVYMIEKTNILVGSFSFEANSAFIKTSENILFVGKDSTISRISITKE